MDSSPVTDALSDEERVVVGWRFDRLVSLGLDVARAEDLALTDLDIHELERIVGVGCDLDLAIRVIA